MYTYTFAGLKSTPHRFIRPVFLSQEPSTRKKFEVIKVAGDGDCLFHALGCARNIDGSALRINVANYMEANAHGQHGFEEEWRREAAKLRENIWGGYTAIGAYSLMQQARVLLHIKNNRTQEVTVEEISHRTVFGNPRLPEINILYNSIDHYDALVEIASLEGMIPAWSQDFPLQYFTSSHPCPSAETAEASRFTEPRPPRKHKAKKKSAPKPPPDAQPAKTAEANEDISDETALLDSHAHDNSAKAGTCSAKNVKYDRAHCTVVRFNRAYNLKRLFSQYCGLNRCITVISRSGRQERFHNAEVSQSGQAKEESKSGVKSQEAPDGGS